MSTEPRLRAEGIVVHRRGRRVLHGVDLEVRGGEMLAIVGPNGAGKTTLLKALLGLVPFEGSVRVNGHELRSLDGRERASALGYVPQQSELRSPLRVRDVVALGRFAHGVPSRAAVDEAMERAGATALADRPFPALSLGEQRRVLLARALASGAPIVLLDEPDAFLDVGQALDLFALLGDLRSEGRALLLVLHDLDRAHRFADRALLLERGEVVGYGPTREALDAPRLRRVFGVDAVPGAALGFRRAVGEVAR